MKKKALEVALCVLCSALPCVLYSILLRSHYNGYIITSTAKLALFVLFPLLYFTITGDAGMRGVVKLSGDRKYLVYSGVLALLVFIVIIVAFALIHTLFDRDMVVGELLK